MTGKWKLTLAAALPLVVSGCIAPADIQQYTLPDAGFSSVSGDVKSVTGDQSVWVQSQSEAEELSERVHKLVHKKTISADTAVQVALLNNKGLQAAYADIGLSAVEVWQQGLLENPKVSVEILGINAPGLGAYRSIEGWIATNLLALATRDKRVDIADTRFRQAQQKAILETLRLAGQTRNAWVNSVAAFERVYYLNQGQVAADAASRLAKKLGESGALTKSGQAREHVFYSELTGQKAKAKLATALAKEELTRMMGLWGSEVDYFVPDQLPSLPKRKVNKNRIEADALQQRVDLQIAKLELEAVAKSYGLTDATRYVTDLEIVVGKEKEKELDGADIEIVKTPQVEFEFVIPIFDSGKARLRKAELAYMRSANLLAEKAVNIRSEARAAYKAYRATYDIARHYRNSVLPLRTAIEEEGLLTYNGMITNTFELLADTRAKINAIMLATDAKREFWLADAGLIGAVFGGGSASEAGGGEMQVADSGGGEH